MKDAWMQAWLPMIAFVFDNKIIMFTNKSNRFVFGYSYESNSKEVLMLMFLWYPLMSGRVNYSLTGINNMPSDKIQNVTLS